MNKRTNPMGMLIVAVAGALLLVALLIGALLVRDPGGGVDATNTAAASPSPGQDQPGAAQMVRREPRAGVDGAPAQDPEAAAEHAPVTEQDCANALLDQSDRFNEMEAIQEARASRAAIDELDAEWHLDEATRAEAIQILDDAGREQAAVRADAADGAEPKRGVIDGVANYAAAMAALRVTLGDARADRLVARRDEINRQPPAPNAEWPDDEGLAARRDAWMRSLDATPLVILRDPVCNDLKANRAEQASQAQQVHLAAMQLLVEAGADAAVDITADDLDLDDQTRARLREVVQHHTALRTSALRSEWVPKNPDELAEATQAQNDARQAELDDVYALLGHDGGERYRKIAYDQDELDEAKRQELREGVDKGAVGDAVRALMAE